MENFIIFKDFLPVTETFIGVNAFCGSRGVLVRDDDISV